MLYDSPATDTPIERLRVVGQPHPRIDGALKTTGTAPYAYERHDVAEGQVYGWPVVAGIPKGRILGIDTLAARGAPGVLGIVTAPEVGPHENGPMNTALLFGGDRVQHYHQAIAVVIAETFEQARAAAALVSVDYAPEAGRFDLHAAAAAHEPGDPDMSHGDFESAFAEAPVTIDQRYSTPGEYHAAMEPHATIAAWEGDRLTVWTSNQMIAWARRDLATVLGIPQENIRVDSPYIGGGFGGKLFVRSDVVMAAHAARRVGRPVKVMLPRPFITNNGTHRAATLQHIRIGAGTDGRITALSHESTSGNLPGGSPETATAQSEMFYAGANRMTRVNLVELDLPEGNAMRAPGETPGLMALEIAMDEMAEALKMDPVAFRALNDTQVNPANPDRRFSRRNFVDCLERGAAAFGWSARNPVPGQRREGDWLIGHGMAGAFRGSPALASGARVRLQPDGRVIVESDMTDIGTGSYTIMAQTAAEMMGLELGQIEMRLGDSDYPVAAGSGGQFGASCSTAGVYAACVKLREAVAKALGLNQAEIDFSDGMVRSGARAIPLAEAAAGGEIVVEDTIEFGDFRSAAELDTFGAHFVEVGVNVATGETRVRRMLAVCDSGRILNPITARSQVIGAMTMGVGAALSEELAVDTARGFFVNHDLASYEVPVHSDIPSQEVIFIEDTDANSSPLKAKGIGELGLCGVGAAISNAVYNATGVRVRDYPLTLDKLLAGLPEI
ncbi:xanthine dehydrogenase family protein molybdopterin-binding subunit [Paroceanicella profunda]|uniref:Xanthine dehydrogenase family protein molybdopterin-binding subunit n=1 Tax=Paroceanicella profunda TaxID=2579971 RepID=A0A5B8FXN2_9RHOB|nr:aldehyde oxidoreductase molybdenum-binding subunit PaoC [Paroceanicella profunda]QDL91282.1 xanthine dehydrogenase family protein molybdopterin-binding subunit [Paroceanicella profunda]